MTDTLPPLVARLIERHGTPMLLRLAGPALYDPATGTVQAEASERSVDGIVEDVSIERVGGLIEAGDRTVTLAAAAIAPAEPRPGDRLTIDGAPHRVIAVSAVHAGAVPALWRLHVRR